MTARAYALCGIGLLVVLTGCAGTRPAAQAGPQGAPPSPPAEKAETPTPAAQPAASAAQTDRTPPDASGSATSTANAAPTCSCVDSKSRPKPKPRPRVVHEQAPPQLPTAPAVEDTPPGGVIDAQVRPMSVSVMSIMGKRVRGAKGEDFGRVVDVLADASGRVRTAIIDSGGFLGVGNHRVAVDWPLLRFIPDGTDSYLLLSLSPEKLRTAPEYKDNPRPQILMVPAASPRSPAN